MYKERVITELKKVVGWRNFYDLTEIPTLPTNLTDSESGLVYQSYHPSLLRLDLIQASLPANRAIEEYLDTVETDAVRTVLSKCEEYKIINSVGNSIISTNIIFKNRIRGNSIVNESRFVGIEIDINDYDYIELVINRIGLYLNGDDSNITLYLFNSLQANAIETYAIPSVSANSFSWTEIGKDIQKQSAQGTDGGVWYIGYYQDDLTAQAIQMKTFNWKNGYCGGCEVNSYAVNYNKVSKYVSLSPFYIAASKVPAQGVMFDVEDVIYTFSNNWGLNLNVTVGCDLSQYWIDNRLKFKDAIGYMVAYNVLAMISSSSQVSSTEQNIQPIAMSDLKGLVDYKDKPFMHKIDKQIKAISFSDGNQSNSPCLPCAKKGAKIRFA